jgi:hypothetical protein
MGNERSQRLYQQLRELENKYEDLGSTIRETNDLSVLPALGQRAGEVKKQIEQVCTQLNHIDQLQPSTKSNYP